MPPKRRLGIDPANIIEGDPRGKRRKDSDSQPLQDSSSPAPEIEAGDQDPPQSSPNTTSAPDTQQLLEQGLRIWNVVKDARGKEQQDLSYDFMRLPSKKQYADYYLIIKHPICLEDIKARLEASQYSSLEAVKWDFDLCFKNARKYNIKESGIYKAAKYLQKLVAVEFAKLPGFEGFKPDEDIDIIGDDGSGEEAERRKRKHSLSRSLKNKLNKLCEKTDDSGRLLCTPFMEPPDKRLYADYYKIIKKVMCFDLLYRKLKRKEYTDANAFTADVELMFSNAISYNADHSMIWEDAHTLRDLFRKLMETLPPEFAVSSPNLVSVSTGKIKLKLPGASSVQKAEQQIGSETTTPSPNLTLKVPINGTSSSRVSTPITDRNETHEVKSLNPPLVPVEGLGSVAGKPLLTAQPTVPASTSIGSRGVFPIKSASASPAPTPLPQPPAALPSNQHQAYTPSPAPPEQPLKHPIQSVILQTTPHGRTFYLDREEGVRIWSVRLGVGERVVKLSQLHFVEDCDEGTDAEDGDDDDQTDEEDNGNNKGRRKGVVKEKGRSKKERGGEKENDPKKVPTPDPIAKLNGVIMKSSNGLAKALETKPNREWQGELNTGFNTLELRAGDIGETWKILLERQVP